MRVWTDRSRSVAITIGNDHAGFEMKWILMDHVRSLGFIVNDVGTFDTNPVDYPDSARLVAQCVQRGGRGILICGSGVGASIAANKLHGIRAAVVHDSYSAHQGVEHDDMNILVLGARVIGVELAKELVAIFLATEFSGEARHVRRLEKISALEIEADSSRSGICSIKV